MNQMNQMNQINQVLTRLVLYVEELQQGITGDEQGDSRDDQHRQVKPVY